MPDGIDDEAGGWWFRVRRANHAREGKGWLGWCARTPDLGENPITDLPLHLDVRFHFGADPHEVLAILKAEVLN
jgi:hypothetical protein